MDSGPRLGGAGVKIERGTVLLLDLHPTLGREQHGLRPCVAVSDPDVAEEQRYPLLAIVPLTGTEGRGALYPRLEPGASGLTKVSYALIDHIRSVDKRRVLRAYGRVAAEEIHAIDEGLTLFLGLARRHAPDRRRG
jgi:mRNA interferase MazF